MEYVKLYWKRLLTHAKAPTRATPLAAGTDLYSAFEYFIPPRGKVVIDTGIQLIIPTGHYGRLAAKSGKSKNYSLEVGAGVIDMDYTGSLQVVMYNHSDKPYDIGQGEPVVQIILEKISIPLLEEVKEISPTSRGTQGFGALD